MLLTLLIFNAEFSTLLHFRDSLYYILFHLTDSALNCLILREIKLIRPTLFNISPLD
jgi:hypothetical protein